MVWYHRNNIDYVEKDSVNHIWIETEACPSRNLVLAVDTTWARIKETWTPIRAGAKLGEPLAEYTMTTAERLGGIKYAKDGNGVEYVDNSEVYWEKGFEIMPSQGESLHLTLYCRTGQGLDLINSIEIAVK